MSLNYVYCIMHLILLLQIPIFGHSYVPLKDEVSVVLHDGFFHEQL